jgi:hypothetical protein
MAIPGTQLSSWANQGATTTAASTYNSVQTALRATTSPVRGRSVETYLQGSYKNDTNVRGDSDVDVITQINDVYYTDLTYLNTVERQAYDAQRSPASYSWDAFRADVLMALQAYYGTNMVVERDKCISVLPSTGRLAADILVAAQHRLYASFSPTDPRFVEGITFWTGRDHRQIVNWPKVHWRNGVEKNRSPETSGRYKPTVRVFKNARSAAVDRNLLAEASAPSFFVECLIYNVPSDLFRSSHAETFVGILNWLDGCDMSSFTYGHRLTPLFGPSPEQWSVDRARRTVQGLIALWNYW